MRKKKIVWSTRFFFSVSVKKEMEQKSVLLSALGVGVGLGIGLASGQTLGRWANGSGPLKDGLTGEQIEQELLKQILDGRESTVTFNEFPYFLR